MQFEVKSKNSNLKGWNSSWQLFSYSLILFAFLLTLSSCSDSFQALGENDQYYFSIYGYLDASADTQWVRISPAREQIETPEEIPDMSVTVENLDTGEIITMKDSLFQQRGANFLNFWTTEKINHNQKYRLTAERPTGEKSQVTVDMPGVLPTPLVVIQTAFGQPTTYLVVVDDNVNVADVQSKYYVRVHTPNSESRRVISFNYRNSAEHSEMNGGSYTYFLRPEKEEEEIEKQILLPSDGELEILHRQIFVASSGSQWTDEVASLDDLTYSLPEVFSNVENGVGFLTGIDSKYVPYASCENEEKTNLIPCQEEKPYW